MIDKIKKKARLWHHYGAIFVHKAHVFRFLIKTCWSFVKRGIVHDFSKFSSKGAPAYAEVTAELEDLSYGSDEYYEAKERLDEAIEHHYAHNSHHPEHYENGMEDMSLLDLIEMLCDWRAATIRHNDGDIRQSVDHNADRFGYDDTMKRRFHEFFDEINGE